MVWSRYIKQCSECHGALCIVWTGRVQLHRRMSCFVVFLGVGGGEGSRSQRPASDVQRRSGVGPTPDFVFSEHDDTLGGGRLRVQLGPHPHPPTRSAFHAPLCIVLPSHSSLKLCALEWWQFSSSWSAAVLSRGSLPKVPRTPSLSSP